MHFTKCVVTFISVLGNANHLEDRPNSGLISESEVSVIKSKNTVSGIKYLTSSSGRNSTIVTSRTCLLPPFALHINSSRSAGHGSSAAGCTAAVPRLSAPSGLAPPGLLQVMVLHLAQRWICGHSLVFTQQPELDFSALLSGQPTVHPQGTCIHHFCI